MGEQFVSVNLGDVLVGEELPVTLYVYLNFRFVTFRAAGDTIDRTTYDRLEMKRVKNLFILEKERPAFDAWIGQRVEEKKSQPPMPAELQGLKTAREDAHRKLYDIFQTDHPEKAIAQAVEASKTLVNEVTKFPFAVPTLAHLQIYSQGVLDHSINVSVLSTYLAMQMGYSHALILQHVGAGGLLHDIGKPKVPLEEGDSQDEITRKMLAHPVLGEKLMESQQKVPNEVKMIVAQHHECHDGSGFPKKLRGSAIYDLARIVAIANVFDELVGDGKGSLLERQRAAIQQMDQVLYRKFDPQKLDKALKILRLGV
jgi:putative nucleotidyltransferase with HDIG domain